MIEKEVSIPSHDVTLAGTLCLPRQEGEFPTVLWLQGSGPIDRNDNMPGQALNNSKFIAHHLADHGIASLRYDKRGVGSSTGEFLSAGHSDLVKDGFNCLKFLSQASQCDSKRLFVIGHSEGAIIAPQISQKFPDIAGIILLCPFIEDFESALMRQAQSMKKMVNAQSWFKRPLVKLFSKVFDPVKNNRKALLKTKASNRKVGRLGLSKQPFYWFKQLLELNLVDVYKNTTCPVLAIAGEKDFQCLPSDIDRIGKVVGGEYEHHTVENMSHLLRNEPGEFSVFNYAEQLKHSIEPKVLTLVCRWLKQRC
ncbi:MAG: alpha/beta hydrolase family protein [Pseudohongiellaceae bacterium]